MKTAVLDRYFRNSNKRWFFLALATLSQLSVAVIRMGIPALIPFIKRDLDLRPNQIGLVIAILNGGAAAAGIPAGKAADRIGERIVLAYGTIASGLIILLVYGAANFPALLLLLLFTGFMTTTSVPASGRAVAGWFPQEQRATAMGLRQMGIPLGGAISAVTLPPTAIALGWRVALSLSGLFAIGAGAAALLLYEEPTAGKADRREGPAGPGMSLLTRKNIQALLGFGFILSVGQWCYLTYLTLYMIETLGFTITLAANLLAVAQICGALGRIFWGLVSDRMFSGRRTPVLILIATLASIMTVLLSLLSHDTPVWLVSLTAAALGLSLQGWNGLGHTLASELAESHMAGLAVGMMNSAGFLGVIAATPVFGLVVEAFGYRLAWLGLASLIMVAIALLTSIGGARETKT